MPRNEGSAKSDRSANAQVPMRRATLVRPLDHRAPVTCNRSTYISQDMRKPIPFGLIARLAFRLVQSPPAPCFLRYAPHDHEIAVRRRCGTHAVRENAREIVEHRPRGSQGRARDAAIGAGSAVVRLAIIPRSLTRSTRRREDGAIQVAVCRPPHEAGRGNALQLPIRTNHDAVSASRCEPAVSAGSVAGCRRCR